MRFPTLFALSAAVLFPAAAMAGNSNHVCNYRLNYDVSLDDGAVHLEQDDRPSVTIEGDRLWIDGREQALSAADHRSVAAYGTGMKQFMQGVTHVALQGVQMGLEGAALAISTLTGQDNSADLTRRLDEVRAHLSERLDGRHLPSDLLGDDFDQEIESAVEGITADAMEDMGAGMGRLMMLAVVAPSRLEARADRMQKIVEAQMEKRSAELERQADGLCGQARALDRIEDSLGRFDALVRDEPSI